MLSRILAFSVTNRWLVVIAMLFIGAIGVVSLQRLPIDAVPDITNNQVQINALAPSLSPFEVEKQVTFNIENALSGIPGLQYTRSLSRNGFSQTTAVFDDDVDIYFARQQVNERLSEAQESLPPAVEPRMGPIATGLGEIYMYTVEFDRDGGGKEVVADGTPGWQSDGAYVTPEGKRLDTDVERIAFLREVQDWIIRPQLKRVKNVAGVDAIGGHVKQYQIQPDPLKLVARDLTFADVIDALEKNNVSTGAGYIEHRGESYLVRATGRIEAVDQIGQISFGHRGGVPVYLKDVVVEDGIRVGRELRTGSASENGEEVVVGTAVMLLGANSRTVAADVDRKMQEIQRSLPAGVRAKTVLNRTKLVDATIATVEKNLFEGAVLVIVVLLVMLGNFRAAIICALAIPLSMLITATAMVQSKLSGNLMSLGAIDFGLIVDGAVIIVENCLRRLSEKQHHLQRNLSLKERLDEVREAAQEMIQPSVYGQAIIITVYFPILALTGVEGKMFHPMAMTVIFALIAAFILSITFIPALVALFIGSRVSEHEVRLVTWVKGIYEPVLRKAILYRWPVVSSALTLFIVAVILFARLGQEFVPTLDEKDIAMHAMRIPSTSLTQSTEMQLEIERTLTNEFPEIAFVYSKTGTAELASDPMPPNVSDTFIILKQQAEWRPESVLAELVEKNRQNEANQEDGHNDEKSQTEGHKAKLVELIESTLKRLPGHNYEFTQPIQMRFNELISGVRGDVAIKVYGDDFDAMQKVAQKVFSELSTIPGAADAKVEQTTGLPVLTVDIQRSQAARYGLSIQEIQDVIAAAIGGRDSGLVFEGDRRFDLVVRLPDFIRDDLESMKRLPIPLRGDSAETTDEPLSVRESVRLVPKVPYVPLGELANITITEGPNQISRENGKRRIVVQANVRGRDLGSFVEEAQEKLRDVTPAPGGWIEWGGQYENLVGAKRRLMLVVPACFLLILLLLFSSFRSVRQSLLVFTAVPLGLTGGVLALWLRGMPFSISAAVGFIALSGVAVLNGLVMITFINQLRSAGHSLQDSIMEGSLTRLRPVLMTALVASLGFVPMALASGTGAEVQKPLATVVIGGLISSTLLTLIVLPALYRIFESRSVKDAASESPQP